MVDFNLQNVLQEMHKEQRDDARRLNEKMDEVLKITNEHESRLQRIEGFRRFMIWVGGALAVGLVLPLAVFYITHR